MNVFQRLIFPVVAMVLLGIPAPVRAADAGAQFRALAQQFFNEQFQQSPTAATQAGVHDYDLALDDMSAAAIGGQIAKAKAYLAQFQAIDPAALSADDALDRTLILNAIQDDLLSTAERQEWRHDPNAYTGLASGGVFLLISRDFAPLEVRMRDAIARELAIPNLFAQAEANLTTVDEATKQVSYEQAAGSVSFFKDTVPQSFAGVRSLELQNRLRVANDNAIAALTKYVAFIGAIKPQGTFAIGRDSYQKRLQYEDALDIPVETYLSYGERWLAQTRAWFIRTAKKISPSKTPAQVYASLAVAHPPPGALVQTAQDDLVRLRTFIVSHHIVSVPSDADIKVIPTPPFARAFITAAEDSPGPLETIATQAYYFVTPIDPSWPLARQAGFLTQFNKYQFPIISAHEVYPGHFTNFSIERHLPLSLTRKLLSSSEFAEGWAHYDEQMVVDQGWGNGDPRVRLAQLEEALLRECRYVAGVKLHTQGWTLAQAEQLFRTQCFQTPAVALEETLRATQDPMYGYYTLGKMMIMKLRSDYKKMMGAAYSLQKFHDALLAHGDPPLPLLRPLILGGADDGKPL